MITEKMQVIRKEKALRPRVGVVTRLFTPYCGRKPVVSAKVEWTRPKSVSTVAVDHLLEASPENIAKMQEQAKKLTPIMKSLLKLWSEKIGNAEFVRFDDMREKLGFEWDAWWSREKAMKKLIVLGYFEEHKDNGECNMFNKQYRLIEQ